MKIRKNLRKLTDAELEEYDKAVSAESATANVTHSEAQRIANAAWTEWCKWINATEAVTAETARRERKLRKDYKPMHTFSHSLEKNIRGNGWDFPVSECSCGHWKITVATDWLQSMDKGWDEVRTSELIHLKWAKAQDEAMVEELVTGDEG